MEQNIYKFLIVPQYERYYNEDTNWGVYTFTTKDELPEYNEFKDKFAEQEFNNIFLKQSSLAGKMQKLYIGSEYNVEAKLEYNKKYESWQYNPINISAIAPKTKEQTRKFLESIITPRQVDILIEAYPNIVEDVMNGKTEDIDLEKTKGIKDYTWNLIKEKIVENYVISDILIMLQPLGVTYGMIKKLIKSFGNSALLKKQLLENPYILTQIHGLGFKTVDTLALKLVPDLRQSFKRAYAYIKYYLIEEIGERLGHTWVNLNTLENAVRDNIPECQDLFEKIVDIEKETKALLYFQDDRVSLKYFRQIEENIFGILKELNGYKNDWKINVVDGIKEAEKEQGFELTEEQREVVNKAIKDNIVVISGKAGTGKTTISKALLKIFQRGGYSIGACALSAKAAQRIKEATGFPASTIHRMLGAQGLNEYSYNHDNPLPYDIILVDECSMINAKLFFDLLLAIKPSAKIIMCGDNRQLPPIGFGNIYSDLLEKKEDFNINELTKVMRQVEKSGILSDANMIREGNSPIVQPELKIIHGELQDMYYVFRDNREQLQDIAIKTYMKSIEEFGLDEVVIITPRKKDCINSSREINLIIQDKLINNKQSFLQRGNVKYKLGAKVMQITNNYDKNIFNGEIGYITKIYKVGDMDRFEVEYPDNKVIVYGKNELDQLELAYAMTVHKSQGSGYKVVIVIIDNTHYTLLDTTLLYTAITRAKQRCLLLAEPSAYKKCLDNNKSIVRQTWLKELEDIDIENMIFNRDVEINIEEDETEF
jgi:exodeoxyribonuclease V alpha subunit